MAVTVVNIIGVNVDTNHATITWQGDDFANNIAECYVACTQADLANPAKRITKPGFVPDMSFQAEIPAVGNGDTPLAPGAAYFCQAMMENVLSAPQQFTTQGGSTLPLSNVQVMFEPINPLTVKIAWKGPWSEKGRVFMGTASGVFASVGEDLVPGECHTVTINQIPGTGNLQFNQKYFYKVASVDASGTVLGSSDELVLLTPKQASGTVTLQAPPAPLPTLSQSPLPAGGRCVITFSVRDGASASNRNLIEFQLTDPSMGKLGAMNLFGTDRIQLLSDPKVYESVDFFSSGKKGTATVRVRVVGGTNPNAQKTVNIQVV
jgi:hypothetical protein